MRRFRCSGGFLALRGNRAVLFSGLAAAVMLATWLAEEAFSYCQIGCWQGATYYNDYSYD